MNKLVLGCLSVVGVLFVGFVGIMVLFFVGGYFMVQDAKNYDGPRYTEPEPTHTPREIELAEIITAYIDRNFTETTWYSAIERIEVSGRRAIAHTNLDRRGYKAKAACGVVSGWVHNRNDDRYDELDEVQVRAADGGLLIFRRDVTERCE